MFFCFSTFPHYSLPWVVPQFSDDSKKNNFQFFSGFTCYKDGNGDFKALHSVRSWNWKSKEIIFLSLTHRKYEEGKGSKTGEIGLVSLFQSLLCQVQGLDYLLQARNGQLWKNCSWAVTRPKAHSGGRIGVPFLGTEGQGQTRTGQAETIVLRILFPFGYLGWI